MPHTDHCRITQQPWNNSRSYRRAGASPGTCARSVPHTDHYSDPSVVEYQPRLQARGGLAGSQHVRARDGPQAGAAVERHVERQLAPQRLQGRRNAGLPVQRQAPQDGPPEQHGVRAQRQRLRDRCRVRVEASGSGSLCELLASSQQVSTGSRNAQTPVYCPPGASLYRTGRSSRSASVPAPSLRGDTTPSSSRTLRGRAGTHPTRLSRPGQASRA